jgi:hypothetical protein
VSGSCGGWLAYNGSENLPERKLSGIKNGSVIMTEQNYYNVVASDRNFVYGAYYYLWNYSAATAARPAMRHDNFSNTLCLDGHCASYTSSSVFDKDWTPVK